MSTNPTPTSLWFQRPRSPSHTRLRLFCFPYAGGGAAAFADWPRHLPGSVEVCPARMPGRAERMREPPFTRLAAAVEDLAAAIRPLLDVPSVFFGHSMGALIGFELTRRLRLDAAAIVIRPSHLYVSGCRAPQAPAAAQRTYLLPDALLLERLGSLSGTPRELLRHGELMRLMLPLIRADIELTETYEYRAEPPLALPITACGGERDPHVRRLHLEAWKRQTASAFTLRMFDGDHFFLHQSEGALLEMLAHDLHQLAGSY